MKMNRGDREEWMSLVTKEESDEYVSVVYFKFVLAQFVL